MITLSRYEVMSLINLLKEIVEGSDVDDIKDDAEELLSMLEELL